MVDNQTDEPPLQCPCGSGLWPEPVFDRRGDKIGYICARCAHEKADELNKLQIAAARLKRR
jgi:DNA-directed RNA polymerase subunit RPC12/RpoP